MASREYFSHDYYARTDPKLVRLAMQYGMEGLGIYWCIIEMLYESDGYIDISECERIAFELRTDSERIASIIRSNVFSIAGEKFYSESVLNRMEKRAAKSEKASISAQSRWRNNSGDDANAMRTQCERNAIKVNKSKVNNNKREDIGSKFFLMISENDNPNQVLVKRFQEWIEFRKKIKKPYKTVEGAAAAYNKLLLMSDHHSPTAIEIIEQSIANEWQGLFPLKDPARNGKTVNGKPITDSKRRVFDRYLNENHE